MIRLFLLSYSIPLLCEVTSYAVSTALHVINPINGSFLNHIDTLFGADKGSLIEYLAYTFTLGIFWDLSPPSRYDFGVALNGTPVGTSWILLSIIEEIGWSGALYPVLEVVFAHSSLIAAVLCGLVWALWHWPFLIAAHLKAIPDGTGMVLIEDIPASKVNMLYQLVAFTLTLVGSRIIMCWMQGPNSYSIWTSVIYHASHNLFLVSVFGQLVAPLEGRTHLLNYFTGESSICYVVAIWFSAFILSRLCCSSRTLRRILLRKSG